MMKKLYSLLLILTPIKKVHAFQKFMSVLITFVAINYEEMLKKDLTSKYFLEVNVVVIRTNPPSVKYLRWNLWLDCFHQKVDHRFSIAF